LTVKVTDSFGSKLVPATVKDPSGTEHPELAVIPIAFGSYAPNAGVDQKKIIPRPRATAVATRLRLTDTPLADASGVLTGTKLYERT